MRYREMVKKRNISIEMEIKTIFIVCLIRLEIRLVVVITSELYRGKMLVKVECCGIYCSGQNRIYFKRFLVLSSSSVYFSLSFCVCVNACSLDSFAHLKFYVQIINTYVIRFKTVDVFRLALIDQMK